MQLCRILNNLIFHLHFLFSLNIFNKIVFQMFVQEFEKKKAKSTKSFEHERMQESRWAENWARSVQKVKALY